MLVEINILGIIIVLFIFYLIFIGVRYLIKRIK